VVCVVWSSARLEKHLGNGLLLDFLGLAWDVFAILTY
jgi:hypothetical protein